MTLELKFAVEIFDRKFFIDCTIDLENSKKSFIFAKNLIMTNEIKIYTVEDIESKVYRIRGVQVMLDADLAAIYGYSTKRFNEQIKNNIERFDDDFVFQLSEQELKNLRSKFLTANFKDQIF